MNILLTCLSLVALLGCFLAYTRCQLVNDRVDEAETRINVSVFKLREERARVTTLERETDALRRELRKLGGKFYATQRELGEKDAEEQIADAHVQVISAPVCDNYVKAQQEGPRSQAAACQCAYCNGRRAAKDAFRRGQARAGHLDPSWVKAHAGGQVDVGEN